jgi:hypothetical protein
MGERATWHHALSLIAVGRADRAKPLLEKIKADAGHAHHQGTVDLLEKLN